MRRNKLKMGLATLAALAGTGSGAKGVPIDCVWVGCDYAVDCLFDFCWCEGSWADSANWIPVVPETGNDTAKIKHHNLVTTTCAFPPTVESWTQIDMATKTFAN